MTLIPNPKIIKPGVLGIDYKRYKFSHLGSVAPTKCLIMAVLKIFFPGLVDLCTNVTQCDKHHEASSTQQSCFCDFCVVSPAGKIIFIQ